VNTWLLNIRHVQIIELQLPSSTQSVLGTVAKGLQLDLWLLRGTGQRDFHSCRSTRPRQLIGDFGDLENWSLRPILLPSEWIHIHGNTASRSPWLEESGGSPWLEESRGRGQHSSSHVNQRRIYHRRRSTEWAGTWNGSKRLAGARRLASCRGPERSPRRIAVHLHIVFLARDLSFVFHPPALGSRSPSDVSVGRVNRGFVFARESTAMSWYSMAT